MRKKIPVAVAGCTGLVGQCFLRLLADHPWFEVAELVSSSRSANRRYEDVVNWSIDGCVPEEYRNVAVRTLDDRLESRFLFSALPPNVARRRERELADRGHLVFSNASALRHEPDIPLVIPEINGHQLDQVKQQGHAQVGGGIVTNPNCVVAGLGLVLDAFRGRADLGAVTVVTMQSLSGAGRHALTQLDSQSRVAPNIPGEAGKISAETRRILADELAVSVMTNRVPVKYGHMMSVFVRTRAPTGTSQFFDALNHYRGQKVTCGLPTASHDPIVVLGAQDDFPGFESVNGSHGMTVFVRDVESESAFDIKFTIWVHNLVRGAAGAGILNAELAVASALLPDLPPVVGAGRGSAAVKAGL